jgi:hypothetical protein
MGIPGARASRNLATTQSTIERRPDVRERVPAPDYSLPVLRHKHPRRGFHNTCTENVKVREDNFTYTKYGFTYTKYGRLYLKPQQEGQGDRRARIRLTCLTHKYLM